MKEKTRHALLLISFGVLLFAAVMNFSVLLGFLWTVMNLLFPILLGMLFAFVLNVPMTGFEKLLIRLTAKAKRKPSVKFLHGMSLMLTLISIALVVALALFLVIPELVTSAKSVWPLLKERWPIWVAQLKVYQIDLSAISDWVENLDMKMLVGGANTVVDSAIQAAASTASGIANTVFGLVISIYILLTKSTLGPQVRKLIRANLREDTGNRIYSVASLIRETYGKFLSGQCVEAILLGCLIFVALSLFRLPYAGLIGGKMFGLPGIIFFIPLMAVVYSLVRDNTNRKLQLQSDVKDKSLKLQGE